MFSSTLRTKLNSTFGECVNGFHLINSDPIKEAPWESLNALIFNESGIEVGQEANGNHRPGADLFCSLGGISNKSAKYNASQSESSSFKISSYRLTSVCSENRVGNAADVVTEIENRKNFTFYSVIVRSETDMEFNYDWYMIPSDHPSVNPTQYEWTKKIGKSGKGKGLVTGWETNVVDGSSMHIQFSMSSQLWMNVNVTDEMKKEFIVGSVSVGRSTKLNYLDIHRMCGGTVVPENELEIANILCSLGDVVLHHDPVPHHDADPILPKAPTTTPITTPISAPRPGDIIMSGDISDIVWGEKIVFGGALADEQDEEDEEEEEEEEMPAHIAAMMGEMDEPDRSDPEAPYSFIDGLYGMTIGRFMTPSHEEVEHAQESGM